MSTSKRSSSFIQRLPEYPAEYRHHTTYTLVNNTIGFFCLRLTPIVLVFLQKRRNTMTLNHSKPEVGTKPHAAQADVTLTSDEVVLLHNAERLTTALWKVVAKDHGCTWDEYRSVPYWLRLEDLQTTLERNPDPSKSGVS